MVFADQAADDLSALDPGSDIDDVAGAKTICVVIGDNLPEKRKAGGSTPPLTTHSDQQKRRLTCENRLRRRSSSSGWLRQNPAAGGWPSGIRPEVSAVGLWPL
jgi:hypothetical protein